MEQRASPALLASFFTLLFFFLNIYMVLVLFNCLQTTDREMIGAEIGVFSLLGNALGAFLCPLFLPSGQRHSGPSAPLVCRLFRTPEGKAPLAGIVFILALVLSILVTRAFGVEFWLASFPLRSLGAVLTGMLHPLCYGLFFLACLRSPPGCSRLNTREWSGPLGASENRTGYGVLLFALALALGITARYCVLRLLDAFGITADPLASAAIAFNAVTAFIAAAGASALVCVVALSREAPMPVKNNVLTVDDSPSASPRTDWPSILCLIGIVILNRVLSGMMEWRLSAYLAFMDWTNQPYAFALVAVFILCGLYAGRSIQTFVRRFLPLAIILFIFIPCMVVFDGEKHAGFFLFMII
jgi:hypothetical protein